MGGHNIKNGKSLLDIAAIESMASLGMSQNQIAHNLGISPDTLSRHKKDFPNVADAINRGKAHGIQQVTNALFERCIEGNVSSMIFWLKNQAGWRDQPKDEDQNTTPVVNITMHTVKDEESMEVVEDQPVKKKRKKKKKK